jgi:osmoprotectant transport system ATP-binding protein
MPRAGVKFAEVNYTLADGHFLLRGISLEIESGTTTALLGRSGSGKTTMLRTVNGLVRQTSGAVEVGGSEVGSTDVVKLRRGIGYVIQETGLFPHMTVERNVGLALELEGRPKHEAGARVSDVLQLVGLDCAEYGRRYPRELSGGQRQRVGLARALASDPAVMLMDEPFGALDPLTRAEMQTMLKKLLEGMQKTVLLVTHDLNEALYLADRLVFLDGGEIVADVRRDEVASSSNPAVVRYVKAAHQGELR